MVKRTGRKRMTLSEALALRAQAAAEAEARERVRLRNVRTLKALDAEPICTCPACTRARQRSQGSAPEE